MSEARGSMSGSWVFVMVLVVAFVGGWVAPNHARAEDELHQARAAAGRVYYEKYCVPCHGKGGAPGSAVYHDSKQPIDLRTYVQRHGGSFPAADWIRAVYNPRPGATHTKVWEEIHHGQEAMPDPDIAARGIVVTIADYIISVQTK